MSQFWRCLEELRGLLAVPAGWRARLDGDFDAVRGAFLRTRPGLTASAVPCPHGCGCAHEVIQHDDGRIVGVCRCDSWNCDDLALREEEIVLLELNWSRLGRAISGPKSTSPTTRPKPTRTASGKRSSSRTTKWPATGGACRRLPSPATTRWRRFLPRRERTS